MYKPRLCQILKDLQILKHRTVKLQPYLRNFILNDINLDYYSRVNNSIQDQAQQIASWNKLDSKVFRNLNQAALIMKIC